MSNVTGASFQARTLFWKSVYTDFLEVCVSSGQTHARVGNQGAGGNHIHDCVLAT